MVLVDSHCHLNMLTDDHNDILRRALDAKVYYMQTVSVKLDDFPKLLAITDAYQGIFTSVGIHPSEVKRIVTSTSELSKLTTHKKVIGIGETGLDYYYHKDVMQQKNQRESFKRHIEASYESNIPLIIHTREAETDTYNIINSYQKTCNLSGLVHCFEGSKEFAKKMLDLGFYISVSGIITFKNADRLRSVVKFIPLDRLLLETDSPYLAPVPKRGKVNEPSYIKYIAEAVANLKEVTFSQCAKQTTDNFFALFNKATKFREL